MQVPKFDLVSNARPSLFAYPSSVKPPKKETVTKVATAVLSTTAKVKAREKKKAAAEGDPMDTVCTTLLCNPRVDAIFYRFRMKNSTHGRNPTMM